MDDAGEDVPAPDDIADDSPRTIRDGLVKGDRSGLVGYREGESYVTLEPDGAEPVLCSGFPCQVAEKPPGEVYAEILRAPAVDGHRGIESVIGPDLREGVIRIETYYLLRTGGKRSTY